MTRRLRRLHWVHEDGQQFCLGEVGKIIEGNAGNHVYGDGAVDKFVETKDGILVYTSQNPNPITLVDLDSVKERRYFDD